MPIEAIEDFLLNGNSNIYPVAIYEILADEIKCKTFHLEIDGQKSRRKKTELLSFD